MRHQVVVLLPNEPNIRARIFEITSLLALSKLDFKIEDWNIYVKINKDWVQIDGIIRNSEHLLVEVKCYKKPYQFKAKDAKRIEIARRINLDGVLFFSSSCFKGDIKSESKRIVKKLCWKDICPKIPRGTYTSLFDEVKIKENTVTYVEYDLKLKLSKHVSIKPFIDCTGLYQLNQDIEVWIRRLAYIAKVKKDIPETLPRSLTEIKEFDFKHPQSEISIIEAWMLEDALRGFAARIPRAIYDTLRACTTIDPPFTVNKVREKLIKIGYRTRIYGVRNNLRNLEILGFLKSSKRKRAKAYEPTQLFKRWKKADDNERKTILIEAITNYLPIKHVVNAWKKGLKDEYSISEYFRKQYKPYFPYAICNMNPNKVYGLLLLANYAGLIKLKRKGA